MTTRRMILLGGVAAGGALIVGYTLWPGHQLAHADKLAATGGERFVSNWIKIAPDDTVTVIVPHCDMGTGIFTSLSQIVAEELDADWGMVKAEQAPADPLFANGALAEGFILSSKGYTAESIPAFLKGTIANSFRTIAEYKDLQVTGGSSAVRFTGVYGMRIAGAAAREMLVKAAAALWNVSLDTCTTAHNRVLHPASGRSISYGKLAAKAAEYSPSPAPQLKPKSKYTIVGQSVHRADIPPKVNGTAQYGIDVRVPGMLYAALKIAPVFSAKLVSVDVSTVERKRGIRKIMTLDNAVVVVADQFWRARDAAAELHTVWNNGADGEVTSASITAKRQSALKTGPFKSDLKTGSGADALAGGRVIAADYSVPYLAHATMEPMNATALFKNGTLEVWSGTQDGLGARAYCAKLANLPLDKVTFHLMHLGGGFGRRLPGYFNFLDYAVRTAMAMPDTPVKLIFTREEDMRHDYYRPNVFSNFKAALDKSGAPLAWVNTYTTEDGANSEARIVYDVANQAIGTVQVKTHVPTGPWRSVEASWHGFFIESFVDELAHAAGTDPLAYRLALLKNSPRHAAVLKLVAEKAGWGTPLPPKQARGIAIFESFQTIIAEVAEVEVADDGTLSVNRIIATADAGTAVNPEGLKAQIESAIVYGLSAALNGAITIDKGAAVEGNFPDYEVVRLPGCPAIDVHILNSGAPYGGGGEPGTPPVAPAVTNAVFAATGIRIRDLPIRSHGLALKDRPQAKT